VDWEAPPKPVWGAPVGMTPETVPDARRRRLTHRPDCSATTATQGRASRSTSGPPAPVEADVGVVDEAANTLVSVALQVTALAAAVAVPLHWLTVTGSAVAAPVTVQAAVGSPA